MLGRSRFVKAGGVIRTYSVQLVKPKVGAEEVNWLLEKFGA
jgi:hypothetical protein